MSVAAHLVLLAAIVFYHRAPVTLTPMWLAHGDGNVTLINFPPGANKDAHPDAAKLLFPRTSKSHPHTHPVPPTPEPVVVADAAGADRDAHAGSPLGTVVDGPITGHEVHVAYSVIHPDPPVARSELPRDLVGDVVIVVTIDSQGNVVETKIVQTVGHGIDEKIEATVRRWHFQPATLDGAPVASHVDVHFHFPS
ncbi:MAG: energy transducer TonB [Terriglobales bacterium]